MKIWEWEMNMTFDGTYSTELFAALLGSASANGFQMVVNGPAPKAMEDFKVVNIYVSFVSVLLSFLFS